MRRRFTVPTSAFRCRSSSMGSRERGGFSSSSRPHPECAGWYTQAARDAGTLLASLRDAVPIRLGTRSGVLMKISLVLLAHLSLAALPAAAQLQVPVSYTHL